jgi:hypothetical protein
VDVEVLGDGGVEFDVDKLEEAGDDGGDGNEIFP